MDLDDYLLLERRVTLILTFSLDEERGSSKTTSDATPLRIWG
jgi:hypothetical protein